MKGVLPLRQAVSAAPAADRELTGTARGLRPRFLIEELLEEGAAWTVDHVIAETGGGEQARLAAPQRARHADPLAV